jgi:hypothetical protein
MDEREDGAREDHGAALKRPSVGLAARVYLRRGWGLVELRPRSKAPVQPGWQETRIGAATVDAIFLPGCNIGLLTGMASAGLVDVDCDTVEARIAATTLLPQTPMAHGRTNGRENGQFTHHWYQIVGDLPKTEKFARGEQTPQTPADGNARETPRAAMQTAMQTTMLIELRADGCQTMVPPSVHPDGGWLRWGGGRVEPLEPARVTAATLRQAVARTAAAALLARYWPARGSRDQAALSLAGWLAQEGWTDDEVDTFILATARAAQDEEW